MVPKIIHTIWLGGRELPCEYRAYLEGAKKLLPDWEFRVWNENNFDFSACKYAREAYEAKKYGFVADFIRVAVLYEYGGFYLDTDAELLRPFPAEMTDAACVLSFENEAYVSTAVLGAEPRHPLYARLKSFYESASFFRGGKADLTPNPFYFTYFLMRDFGMKPKNGRYSLRGGSVELYPREVFSPIDFNTGKDGRTAETVAVHHFANSWSGKRERLQQRLLHGARKLLGRRLFGSVTRLYLKGQVKKIGKRLSALPCSETAKK